MCWACGLSPFNFGAAPGGGASGLSRRRMLGTGVVAAGLVAQAVSSRAEAPPAPAQVAPRAGTAPAGRPILLLGGNVWDGVAARPLGPMQILVQDGRIAAMGAGVDRPDGVQVVELAGRTVTPGFIDSHVHVTLRPEFEGSIFSLSSSYKALLGVQALGILLDNGFTTVRDVGDMDVHGYTTADLQRAVAQRLVAGPRLIIAEHLISTRGGHGDGTPLLGADSRPWQDSLADGVDELRRVVREEVSRGAQWIKFAGSGGFSSPADDPSQVPYSQEEMNVLVETARDLGIPVTLHVYPRKASAAPSPPG